MIIPRKDDIKGLRGIPKGSISDTKRAIVFTTLGLPLDPVTGIFVKRQPDQQNWLDGIAHFTFNVPLKDWSRINAIYDSGTADSELDSVLDELKVSDDPKVAQAATRLERLFSDALIVYGRRTLENYGRMLRFLRAKATQIELKEQKNGAFQFKFVAGGNGQ